MREEIGPRARAVRPGCGPGAESTNTCSVSCPDAGRHAGSRRCATRPSKIFVPDQAIALVRSPAVFGACTDHGGFLT